MGKLGVHRGYKSKKAIRLHWPAYIYLFLLSWYINSLGGPFSYLGPVIYFSCSGFHPIFFIILSAILSFSTSPSTVELSLYSLSFSSYCPISHFSCMPEFGRVISHHGVHSLCFLELNNYSGCFYLFIFQRSSYYLVHQPF